MTRAHWDTLDGVRGLAILMVIAHNVQMYDHPGMTGAGKAFQWVLNFGWVGVTLFFALSGFLITQILLSSVGTSGALPRFIARRTLRIFPLYYATLLVVLWWLPAIGQQPAQFRWDTEHSFWLWAYLSNWVVPFHMDQVGLSHFWSLAVEEQFYLIWPLVVLALKTPRRVLQASLLLALVSLACRAYLAGSAHGQEINYYWTICRMDGLALGAAAAACWQDEDISAWIATHQTGLLIGLTAFIAVSGIVTKGFARTSSIGQTWGYSVLAFTFAALVYGAAKLATTSGSGQPLAMRLVRRQLTHPALTRIGRYSYAMYVFHKPMHDLFSQRLLKALKIAPAGHMAYASIHVLMVALVSYAMAWLSYHLFERHFLALKSKLE